MLTHGFKEHRCFQKPSSIVNPGYAEAGRQEIPIVIAPLGSNWKRAEFVLKPCSFSSPENNSSWNRLNNVFFAFIGSTLGPETDEQVREEIKN